MTWLTLDPARSSMPEPRLRLEVQDHFLKLFWPRHDGFDWDVTALYRSRGEQPIYYFSPGAADPLTRVHEYPYDPCDRPGSSPVTSRAGSSLVVDTGWVEPPNDTRAYPRPDRDLDDAKTAYRRELLGEDRQSGPRNVGPA